MSDFLVELGGCLYTNPEDVVREYDRLRAEVEALRKDAERYQHLRVTVDAQTTPGIYPWGNSSAAMDKAIDAALAAKEET